MIRWVPIPLNFGMLQSTVQMLGYVFDRTSVGGASTATNIGPTRHARVLAVVWVAT